MKYVPCISEWRNILTECIEMRSENMASGKGRAVSTAEPYCIQVGNTRMIDYYTQLCDVPEHHRGAYLAFRRDSTTQQQQHSVNRAKFYWLR